MSPSSPHRSDARPRQREAARRRVPGELRTAASSLLCALAIALAGAPAEAAESSGVVVVVGAAGSHEREVIAAAIARVVRRASWSLGAQGFAPAEVETIQRCLRDDQPWRCLAPILEPRGFDRIVVADASPPGASLDKLIITGQLALAGDGAAAIVQRRCDGCDDEQLAAVAQKLAEQLVREITRRTGTTLEVRTRPPGATVLIDGQPLGDTGPTGEVSQPVEPGRRTLTVRAPGFVAHEQPLDLRSGRTTTIDVALEPVPPRSPVVPLAFAVPGAAAVALGGYFVYLGQQDGPDDRRRYTRATPIGAATGALGLAAIGVAAYLWWFAPDPGGLAVIPIPGGAIAGWAGAL